MSTKESVWKRKRVGMDDQKSQSLLCHNGCQTTINKSQKFGLLSFHQLPEYMKDNQYILGYYRAGWPIKRALFSLFSWHNETLNVWTHLLGFLLFVGLTLANLVDVPQMPDLITMITEHLSSSAADFNISKNSSSLPGTNLVDLNGGERVPRSTASLSPFETMVTNWPLYVFLCGSMFCLLSSSVCHLFSCHSHSLNVQLLHIDYVGITVMIITSFFPPIYYIFQCHPRCQILYLTTITLMGLCTIFALLSPALSSGKYRSLRAMLFVSMGLFGIVPAVHALFLNWDDPRRNLTLAYESAMALSYLVGTAFYVTRIPERWRPGWFDLAGHSHQIFHVLVVMGALAHYGAAQIFLSYRVGTECEV